ncbi:MAG: hypothetical protein ACLQG5_04845 [Methanobacterium sp.]|jgi:hypothetical protein
MNTANKHPLTIIIIAFLMILFGIIEVITAFTHNFLGITTSQAALFTYSAAAIGTFYIIAGLLILTMKKWAAALAIILLGADVIGRITLVGIGLYPINSNEQVFSIIAGTAIAIIFAIYIGWKWDSFK